MINYFQIQIASDKLKSMITDANTNIPSTTTKLEEKLQK